MRRLRSPGTSGELQGAVISLGWGEPGCSAQGREEGSRGGWGRHRALPGPAQPCATAPSQLSCTQPGAAAVPCPQGRKVQRQAGDPGDPRWLVWGEDLCQPRDQALRLVGTPLGEQGSREGLWGAHFPSY